MCGMQAARRGNVTFPSVGSLTRQEAMVSLFVAVSGDFLFRYGAHLINVGRGNGSLISLPEAQLLNAHTLC